MRVTVQSGDSEPVELGDEITAVGAGQVVVLIEGDVPRHVRLDGSRVQLPAGNSAAFVVDMTRSVGFHRLDLGQNDVRWFATDDTKLRLDGLLEMLKDLRTDGTGWSGQIIFSDGSVLRDPHVVYGWLDEHVEDVLQSAEAVNHQPIRGDGLRHRTKRPSGGRVSVARTLKLIRSRPRDLLEVADGVGSVVVDDEAYDPRLVVVAERVRSLDAVWNRRYVRLLEKVADLLVEVIGASSDSLVRSRCRKWLESTRQVLSHPTAQEIRRLRSSDEITHRQVTSVEMSDQRYETLYRASRDVYDLFGWSANRNPLPTHSYVNYADAIYQAWAATRVARALGAARQGSTLGATQPAFTSDEYNIFLDTVPPKESAASWRLLSAVPDALRPDVVVVERSTGEVSLFDAKYRIARGRATEDSRKEVSSYMASYGLAGAGILFPGASPDGVEVVAAQGRQLVEVPLAPASPISDSEVAAAVRQIAQVPPFPSS